MDVAGTLFRYFCRRFRQCWTLWKFFQQTPSPICCITIQTEQFERIEAKNAQIISSICINKNMSMHIPRCMCFFFYCTCSNIMIHPPNQIENSHFSIWLRSLPSFKRWIERIYSAFLTFVAFCVCELYAFHYCHSIPTAGDPFNTS